MEIKKINTDKLLNINHTWRPDKFDEFIGQEHIKWVVKTAIESWKKRKWHMGHILFSGPSGFGKTTMAHIISKQGQVNIKAVTGYAITKPSEIISILNTLENWDILFIDEIHRLKPNIEEVLYIAMEDFVIDMVMPEGGNVRIPINPFTLIGATTKSESLSQPIKNRFVYHFHFMEYTQSEKEIIIKKYLDKYEIRTSNEIIRKISEKVDAVPREIHNLCIKIRDFVITESQDKTLTDSLREQFLKHSQIDEGGMTPLHAKYLEILEKADRPMGVKAIAVQLGINEKAVEEDVEPLLLKLGKIEKSWAGRILIS
ncbi:MAG: Holliday junction ATP-dependent DNA helicase ruvB [uncultured bacterium (gcode 4)]|uniref:Holliday junction ATP-dependent DNA helicase ruvB n=1 Tax=uncultured bacterium (gcode 4) TaxID=1234023 RepID=K1XKD5_9BACT|nr:MAG: Holliday junction ATP-dependent DNA helicase ruvB [uncultured bacterium (gcode 4)]